MEREFWCATQRVFGLNGSETENGRSTMEFLVSASLQCLKTPYCEHREWAHENCVACHFGRNKMGAVAKNSKIRGIELARSHTVSDRHRNRISETQSDYAQIRQCLVDGGESVAIMANDEARVTPNG